MTFVAPSGYQPVYNPTIPYVGPIYGGLKAGSSIHIQGSIPENISRFEINLRCGPYESSDIALHFNPRFDAWDKVVFNTYENESWGSEDNIWTMPFCKGEPFEMVVLVTSEGYKISVNGNDFHTFPHRMPVNKVGGIQIAGDVVVQTINVLREGMGEGGGMGGGYPGGDMEGGYPRGNMGGGYSGGDLEDEYLGGMED